MLIGLIMWGFSGINKKMPQETNCGSIFTSPCKNLRGLKTSVSNNEASFSEEIINDYELAQRKAEEAGI